MPIKDVLIKQVEEKKNKKPVVVYCIADVNNFPYALTMIKTLRKFHDWDVYLYTNETTPEKIKLLPKNVTIKDLNPYLQDMGFFYRATPILAEELLIDYELVIKIDADSLILGDLSALIKTTDYDVATVINWNRMDEKFYPLVSGWGILPFEYFNCGFVAMRSRIFAHHWKVLCYTEQFNRMQFKEQDLLNAICYFGNYNVRCLDFANKDIELNDWYGLISKGELSRAIVKDGKIIIPKGLGNQPFPPTDIWVHAIQMAGGVEGKKDNWQILFSPESMERVKELMK
ncbi:MAG: hypothetical protein KGI08_02785 [Thaumarchaeota archaeon]|nr:hypothetical protein [Nitrososphaerota archaeon]